MLTRLNSHLRMLAKLPHHRRPLATIAPLLLLLASLALGACGTSKKSTSASTAANAPTGATSAANTATSKAPAKPVGSPGAGTPNSETGPNGTLSQSRLPASTVVANVGGQKLTLAEVLLRASSMFFHKEEVPQPPHYSACVAHKAQAFGLAGKSPAVVRTACRRLYEELLRRAMNLMIRTRWIAGEAREDGLKANEQALRKEVEVGMKQEAKVGETPSVTGRSFQDELYLQRFDLLAFMLFDRVKEETPKATPGRIAAYYAQHKQSFALPERRDLHLIRTDSQASAKRVLGELRAGKSFKALAKEVLTRQPPRAEEGSVLGLSYDIYEEPHLSNAIFKAPLHVLKGPVKLDASNAPKNAFGYYIFEVLRVHPPEQRPLSAVKAAIAQNLPEILHNQTLKAWIANFRKKWTARTDCRAGFLVEDCSRYRGHQPYRDPYTF
jgi:foldase protein PrsA